MSDKNVIGIDDFLKNQHNTKRKKQANTRKSKVKTNKKRKKVIAIVTASAIALGTGIWGLTRLFRKGNEESENLQTQTSVSDQATTEIPTTTSIEKELNTNSLDKLGVELEFPKSEEAKKEYNDSTGNIDINKIISDNNGTLWIDKEASSKKDDIGKEVIDNKNGELSNGDVYAPETGYEIIDKDGNIVSEGNVGDNGLPDGYEYDDDHNAIIESGYYIAPDGSIWESKEIYDEYMRGEIIVSESTTTEPIEQDPIITEDGYYTDPETGLIFKSKEDYEQWVLQGYEGYVIIDGIMVPALPEINPNNNVKRLIK